MWSGRQPDTERARVLAWVRAKRSGRNTSSARSTTAKFISAVITNTACHPSHGGLDDIPERN